MTKKVRCPNCGEISSMRGNEYRPFCSERCKMSDLGAWAEGKYAIPGEAIEDLADSGEDDDLSEVTYH